MPRPQAPEPSLPAPSIDASERRVRGEKVKERQATRRKVLERLAQLCKTDVATLLDAIGAPDPDVIDRMVDDDAYEARLI